MKKILAITVFTLAASVAPAKGKKIDWSLCERELKEFCAKETTDEGKHECLEKAPKAKVSEECIEKNKKLESQFKGHQHNH